MSELVVGFYARVSSEKQAEERTIESQVAALRERICADGHQVAKEYGFLEEHTGATLIRPALERLRDAVAIGGLDRLYIYHPDRLSRKHAYQVLLMEEFERAGVEVVFLNGEPGRTPESDLLLQVQGIIAEYERARIIERTRRGRRYAAQMNRATALSHAPYGYRYVTKDEGGGEARIELDFEEARVVRQIFDAIGRERMTIGQLARQLSRSGVRTRKGRERWDRGTLWGILRNPAYKGTAAFGKTQMGPLRRTHRAHHGASEVPRHSSSPYPVPPEQWILIRIPPIVEENLFAAVQEQMRENQQRARGRRDVARHLLQGLVVCKQCGYAYCFKTPRQRLSDGTLKKYTYYRCLGSDIDRFGGQRTCRNTAVRAPELEAAVWREVRSLLEDPSRVENEYRRRLTASSNKGDDAARAQVTSQIAKLRKGISRLIDAYTNEWIQRREFEPRIRQAKERLARLEGEATALAADTAALQDLQSVVGAFDDFAGNVRGRLEHADIDLQRDLIRRLVKRIEVDNHQVTVVFRVPIEKPSAAQAG